jgi:hypothetical protein
MVIKTWKKLSRADKTWKNFKSHFTRAINDNKSDTGALKAISIANAVKEQVDQNKENQRVLAQATVEANDKTELLEKQQAQLYAALMAKQPQQQVSPLQDTTAATIKAPTDKINQLESGSGGGGGGSGGREGYRKMGSKNYPRWNNDGVRTTR